MTHEEVIARWIGRGKIGTEIGPGSAPIPGLDPRPIYVDCFESFAGAPCRADYFGHACALPFQDHSLDYVLASHVLEHVANPVLALAEWYRVVRPGGFIYLVVPDRRATWEHTRVLTTVEHMLEDFVRETDAADATHIDEFVFQADWSMYAPDTPKEDVPAKQAELARTLHWAVTNAEEINIHFHTFEPSNVRELLERLKRGASRKGDDRDRSQGAPAGSGSTSEPRSTSLPLAHARSYEENAPTAKHLADVSASLAIPRFNWEIVELAEYFPHTTPNGVLAVLRVDKGWRARADAEMFRLRSQGRVDAVLRDDARPFAAWSAASSGGTG